MSKLENVDYQDFAKRILEWESQAGESFTDQYMHDSVNAKDWANFLEEIGFTERADHINRAILAGEKCICQGALFNVHLCEVEVIDGRLESWDTVEYREDPYLHNELYLKDAYLWSWYILENDDKEFVEAILDGGEF